jgi:hypothetical protein
MAAPPIVFLGPSARREDIAAVCPTVQFLPPIQRDDLYRARERGGTVFLIIDGMFSHCLAVSPREIIDVIRDGALVLGASSMGAVRSAECWPTGMQGLGLIARLYRAGRLDSDDEVAVSVDPVNEFAPLTVALINVRFAVSQARRRKLLDQNAAAAIVRAAELLHFADRQWPLILERAGLGDRAPLLEQLLRTFDLKARDAVYAGGQLGRMLQAQPGLANEHVRHQAGAFLRPTRYQGHDRCFGIERRELAAVLTKWLFGTGRYQPYVWSLVSGEPELCGVNEAVVDRDARAESRREALATVLARRLAAVETLAAELWSELEFMDELDAELMRWHASQTMAALAPGLDAGVLQRVRDEIAIAHGVVNWRVLEDELVDDKLFGAIPFEWIDESCRQIAKARSVPKNGGTRNGTADHGRR